MNTLSRFRLVSVALLALAACAGGPAPKDDPVCSRAICGCWEDRSMQATISVIGGDGQPASGVALSCQAGQETFGKTDARGMLRVIAAGRVSPGCGYIADCETAMLTDREGNTLQTFTLTPLLRGQKIVAGEHTLSIAVVDAHWE